MESVSKLHKKAMQFAERASLARIRGDAEAAVQLFRNALEQERAAAELLGDKYEIEPTRSVLHRSAAALAIECNEIHEARLLIDRAFQGFPPEEIQIELRQLQERVYSKERSIELSVPPKLEPTFPRKFSVFISSTFVDMREVRAAFIDATLRCGHIPIGMEFFLPGPQRDTEIIKAEIESADIFVIIVGARFGSLVKKREVSFLSFEYELAKQLHKPILAFLLAPGDYEEARSSLKLEDTERLFDVELRAFRESVMRHSDGHGRIVHFFRMKQARGDLVATYEAALQQVASKLDTGGWMRAERYEELRKGVGIADLLSANPFFGRVVKNLETFHALSARMNRQAGPKQAVAQFFLFRHLGRIINSGIRRLYFESGSTIAYLSEAFIEDDNPQWLRLLFSLLQIETNNILTYLTFGLNMPGSAELYPAGPPEPVYGASLGALRSLASETPPLRPTALADEAANHVQKIAQRFRNHYQEAGMILMTASGVEIKPNSPFEGPHVGSYHIMLFKRALLLSKCPIVMFLDEDKLLKHPFLLEKCYPVCCEAIPWKRVCRSHPIALAVGCSSEKGLELVSRLLSDWHLDHIDSAEGKLKSIPYWSLLASNDVFEERLKKPQRHNESPD